MATTTTTTRTTTAGRRRRGGCCFFSVARRFHLVAFVVFLLLAQLPPMVAARFHSIDYDCDPCIERSRRVVRMILHGSRDDAFWQLMQVPIQQAADALGITLDFELYEQVDLEQMVRDIDAVVETVQHNKLNNRRGRGHPPDALVVTLPSVAVEQAVQRAVEAGIPVFGMNSGYNRATAVGLLAFVGMDEYEAGVEAGRQFRRLARQQQQFNQDNERFVLQRVLYINHEKGNFALDQRRMGLEDGLLEEEEDEGVQPATNNHNNNTTTTTTVSGIIDGAAPGLFPFVDEALIDGTLDPEAPARLRTILQDCAYQAIMLAGSSLLDTIIEVKQAVCPNHRIFVGAFDTNTFIYRSIAVGLLDFAVSQQQWLQGALATATAGLYATTGMILQPPTDTEFGTYLSGPQIVTIDNLPTDTLQTCETEGFPRCSDDDPDYNAELADRGCACFDAPGLRLRAVTHGIKALPFWERFRSAAHQAARDWQVSLETFDLFPPGDEPEALFQNMASRIISHCQAGIDGLVVTIPSDLVVPALERCRQLNVPIISINAGGAIDDDNDGVDRNSLGLLHHVAQHEYDAGYAAGRQLIREGATRGLCLNPSLQLQGFIDRCDGFGDAVADGLGLNAYWGMVGVAEDNAAITVRRAEQAVERAGGDWNKLGILAAGNAVLPALLTLLDDHPTAIGGTFDTGAATSAALRDGRIVVAVDQQTYLQGYIPIMLLTWFAQTTQSLANRNIASGPSLVVSPPTAEQTVCERNDFAVCLPPVDTEKNQLGGVRTIGSFLGATIMVTASSCALWVFLQRHGRVMRQAQPFFLFMVSLGGALMGSTIFFLGVDDEIASLRVCDVSCMTAPWLFAVGFTIVFAALYSKLIRLSKLLQHAEHFRRITVTAFDVMVPFAILLTLNLALLATWTLADPMYWQRSAVSETESYGLCRIGDTALSITMALGILFVNMMALVLALFEAYKSRKVSYEFSDSGSIALVVLSILQVAIVGVPILPLVKDDPSASYLLKTGLVFVISMSTLLFIFVPKLRKISEEAWGQASQQDTTSMLRVSPFQVTSNRHLQGHISTESIPVSRRASGERASPPAVYPSTRTTNGGDNTIFDRSGEKPISRHTTVNEQPPPTVCDEREVFAPEFAEEEEGLHNFEEGSPRTIPAGDSTKHKNGDQSVQSPETRASSFLEELGNLLQEGVLVGQQVAQVVRRVTGDWGENQIVTCEDDNVLETPSVVEHKALLSTVEERQLEQNRDVVTSSPGTNSLATGGTGSATDEKTSVSDATAKTTSEESIKLDESSSPADEPRMLGLVQELVDLIQNSPMETANLVDAFGQHGILFESVQATESRTMDGYGGGNSNHETSE